MVYEFLDILSILICGVIFGIGLVLGAAYWLECRR